LADAMTAFKRHALNLTWIESFPAPKSKNEYMFFVELSGHRDDGTVRAAVEELSKTAHRLTILGSYCRAV
jgi:chorismate mutase/prephenate dehydratase